MDNAFDNLLNHLDDFLPFAIFLLIIVVGILRSIINALSGGKKGAGRRQPRPQLREFLEQLREQGEAARRGGAAGARPPERRQAGPAGQRGAAVADAEPPRPVGRQRVGGDPLELPRAEPRLGERRHPPKLREQPLRRAPAARRRLPEAEPLAAEPAPRGPLSRQLEERELSHIAGRHVHSAVEDRHVEARVAERRLESGIASALERKFGGGRQRRRRMVPLGFAGLPAGIGLREGVIISTLLGAPRVRQPYSPPWTRGGI